MSTEAAHHDPRLALRPAQAGQQSERRAPGAQSLGLYLHIPFCQAICNYCNFSRGLLDERLKARYVEALTFEIDARGDGNPADTIYFGGGTPSLLAPEEVRALVVALRRAFSVAADAEITMEVNPESAGAARFLEYRRAGVNRLSIGVQSFDDQELTRLGRLHTAQRAREAVAAAREAGFENVSLDLMLGLPEQRPAAWRASVDAAIDTAPDHVSLYLLELYPNAPLGETMTRQRWALPCEEEAAAMYLDGLSRLDEAGYEQYEISNVARPGHRSCHNLKYWTDGGWLGFGTAAHSTRDGVRWRNLPGVGEYIERVASGQPVVAERRVLPHGERLGDALITGLRLAEGLDMGEIQGRYGVEVWETFGGELEPFLATGHLIRSGRRLRLSRAGMLVANEILRVFV